MLPTYFWVSGHNLFVLNLFIRLFIFDMNMKTLKTEIFISEEIEQVITVVSEWMVQYYYVKRKDLKKYWLLY